LPPLRFEMIFCLVKRDTGALLQVSQHFLWKIDMAIQSCAHCRSAERKLTHDFDRFLCAFFRVSDLLRVTGKFLTEPDRCRVHQMGPANLDDVPEFFCLGLERAV